MLLVGALESLLGIHKIVLGIAFILASQASCSSRTIAFLRNANEIWIADEKGNSARFICKGSDPEIDPSGKYIAYTRGTRDGRFIAITDINSRTSRTLRSIPGNNSYGPHWNKTGDKLLFSWFKRSDGRWLIGIVDAFSDREFHLIGESLGKTSYPRWTDKSIICLGSEKIYLLSSDGTVEKSFSKKNIHPYNLNGDLVYSDDGNSVLCSARIPGERLGMLNEPNAALFLLDEKGKRLSRITPKGIYALRPSWFSDKLILFEGFTARDIQFIKGTADTDPGLDISRRLYTINKDGNDMKILVNNAGEPSVTSY